MAWPKQRKRETRQRIVGAAAEAFRKSGIESVGVDEVMARAGLTHGGFYAHFRSKDELVADAMAHASAEMGDIFETPAGSGRFEARTPSIADVAKFYLSTEHWSRAEHGCPVAALGPEIARAGGGARRKVVAELRQRIKKLFARTPPSLSPQARKAQASGALACMVGGMIVARTMQGKEGVEFLADCRKFLQTALEGN
jgi:TetR/AcrR family transcriptional regulator, transcriptional repressor for nem operon